MSVEFKPTYVTRWARHAVIDLDMSAMDLFQKSQIVILVYIINYNLLLRCQM